MAIAVARRRNDDDESGQRLQLRRAIEHSGQTKIRLVKLRDAIEKAEEHKESAAARLESVTGAMARAKELYAQQTAAAVARGAEPPPATTITDARVAELEAMDRASASHGAFGQLQAQLTVLENEIVEADSAVTVAVNALLVGPMAELFQKARQAQSELLACRSALAALYTDAGIRFTDEIKAFHFHEQQRNSAYGKLKAEMRDFIHIGCIRDPVAESKAVEAGERWRRARAALLNDPDAELPAVE
jgi:hypothetical protein